MSLDAKIKPVIGLEDGLEPGLIANAQKHPHQDVCVIINIGGTRFESLWSTLISNFKYFASLRTMQSPMQSPIHDSLHDSLPCIDRDPDLFKILLSLARNPDHQIVNKSLSLFCNLLMEAQFYGFRLPNITSFLPILATEANLFSVGLRKVWERICLSLPPPASLSKDSLESRATYFHECLFVPGNYLVDLKTTTGFWTPALVKTVESPSETMEIIEFQCIHFHKIHPTKKIVRNKETKNKPTTIAPYKTFTLKRFEDQTHCTRFHFPREVLLYYDTVKRSWTIVSAIHEKFSPESCSSDYPRQYYLALRDIHTGSRLDVMLNIDSDEVVRLSEAIQQANDAF